MTIEAKARELAQSLKETPEFEKLTSAQSRLQLDPGAQDLLSELQQQHEQLLQAQSAGQPIRPEQAADLQNLQQQTQQNLTLRALIEAQEDFNQLMEQVNQSIIGELFPESL